MATRCGLWSFVRKWRSQCNEVMSLLVVMTIANKNPFFMWKGNKVHLSIACFPSQHLNQLKILNKNLSHWLAYRHMSRVIIMRIWYVATFSEQQKKQHTGQFMIVFLILLINQVYPYTCWMNNNNHHHHELLETRDTKIIIQ